MNPRHGPMGITDIAGSHIYIKPPVSVVSGELDGAHLKDAGDAGRNIEID